MKFIGSVALQSPLFLIVSIAALAIATTAHAETVTRSFDVAPGGRLVVESDVGSIDVSSHDADRVEIVVEVRGPNADEFGLDFDKSGNEVRIKGDYDRRGGWFGWGGSNPRVRYEIKTPRRFDLDVETSGGSIDLGDFEGEVRADTSGGSIDVGRIDGDVDADTSGGSIELRYASGDARLDTSGGSITADEVGGHVSADTSGGSINVGKALGPVQADTSGGSIRVEEAHASVDADTSGGSIKVGFVAQPERGSRLSTSGGNVTVYLADGLRFDLEASGNRVSCDLPLSDERKSRGSLSGRISGGGPELSLHTSGGGVRIERL